LARMWSVSPLKPAISVTEEQTSKYCPQKQILWGFAATSDCVSAPSIWKSD